MAEEKKSDLETDSDETFMKKLTSLPKKVIKNITLEPVIFFLSFVSSVDSASVSQLVIDKSCNIDFNFTAEVCDNLLNDTNEAENEMVQNEVAQFKVYESVVDHLFPIICSFFLGSWSDTFGRKVLLYIYFVFRIIDGSTLLLNAYFMEWPKEYLLFSVNLPVAIAGGHLAYSMGINAFISDISPPEQRSFRIAMMHFVGSVGRPVGTIIGAYLFKTGGYLCVIGTTLVGRIVAFLLLIIRLEMFKWKPKKVGDKDGEDQNKKKPHACSPDHIMDSIRTVTKKREHGKRTYLWTYLIVMLFIILPFFGEFTISYNYVRTRYGWDVVQYSEYRTITEVVDIVGQAILIPLLGYLKINDSVIIPVMLTTICARHIVKGFAVKEWMYYLGSFIDIIGGYSFAASRSIISKCVESHELGKVFAILASLESLVPIGMAQAYASLWKATSGLDNDLVGACFFLSGGLTTISLVISIVSLVSLRGRDIADLDRRPAKFNPGFRLTENRNFLVRRWASPPPNDVVDANKNVSGLSFKYKKDENTVETISSQVYSQEKANNVEER